MTNTTEREQQILLASAVRNLYAAGKLEQAWTVYRLDPFATHPEIELHEFIKTMDLVGCVRCVERDQWS
jgi:hypothetical protein